MKLFVVALLFACQLQNCRMQSCRNHALRLVGGQTNYEGRVEICVNGQWGTICDDLWGQTDANVVCRQLGYSSRNAVAHFSAHYGQGTGPILLDNVQCTGTELMLINCSHPPVGTHNCYHREDAGVRCQPKLRCQDGEIRLAGHGRTTEREGRVEVCFNEEWGTVCDDYWDERDARVVCRQLGYSQYNATAYDLATHGEGVGQIYLDDVRCNGSEERLVDCRHTSTHNCFHLEDAGVRCSNNNCSNGDIRLVGGRFQFEGRVEVCWNQTWGTVCDGLWSLNDAQVACRQLGFPNNAAVTTFMNAHFGRGTGPILLDDLVCMGNESRLVDCRHDGIGQFDSCTHADDAGVRCRSLSTAPWGLTVDPQSFSFSWSPPNLTDQNGVVTKYTVTITEVENGRKVQQFDVNSTATSVALRDLSLIPCYTYRFSVAAYTVEYGPTATFDMTPTARNRNSTTLLCFQLVNEEVGTEDTSDYIEELSQIITTQVFLNMTLDGHIRDIIFTNISTPTGDGSETVLMVFLQFRNGTLSRGIEEALSCWLAETSSIDISGASLPLIDPPTCLPQYEHTECLQLQSSNGDCGMNNTRDRDIILSVVGGVVGVLILLFFIVGIVALVTRAKRRHKQTSVPPVEPEKMCDNPLYGEQPKTYVDNPSYGTLTTLKQPETEREDESEYMYADPKSSRLHELVSVPFAAPSESEPNHCEDSGQEQQYAKLKLTDAVYKNIEHPDSEIAQEDFYSHLDHRTGNLS